MREPLSMDDYIDLDLDHAMTGGQTQRELAEQLLAWAKSPHPDSELTPGELLTLAGERFAMIKDESAAEEHLKSALATGDWGDGLDPRCHLISLFLEQERTDEALELDGHLRRSRPDSLETYAFMGDLWWDHDDLRRALGWLNRGLTFAEQTGTLSEAGLELLCHTRWAIRQAQGQEPDEYDEMAIASRAHASKWRDRDSSAPDR